MADTGVDRIVVDVDGSSSPWSIMSAALSNLSFCIISTLSWGAVTPTFLVAFTSVSFATHFSNMLAKINMKVSLFSVLKSVNKEAFSFSCSWWIFLFNWSRNCVTPVVSGGVTNNWICLDKRNDSMSWLSREPCASDNKTTGWFSAVEINKWGILLAASGGTIALVILVALNITWQMQTSPIKEKIIVKLTTSQGDHIISAVDSFTKNWICLGNQIHFFVELSTAQWCGLLVMWSVPQWYCLL